MLKLKYIKIAMVLLVFALLVGFTSGTEAHAKNTETDNLNVLFVGIDDDQLKMVSMYSINHNNDFNSAAIFFPTYTLVNTNKSLEKLTDVYKRAGAPGITEVLSDKLEINIDYHILVHQGILTEVAKMIDPIYVAGEEVDLTNLFDMGITPHDDEILGKLVQEFRKPQVFFFSLPELFFSFRRHISTDFVITPSNLYLHYRIARGINADAVTKIIADGIDFTHQDKQFRLITDDTWRNIVYRNTAAGL